MFTTIKVNKALKDEYVKFFYKKNGTRPSISGKVENILLREIEKLKEELGGSPQGQGKQ